MSLEWRIARRRGKQGCGATLNLRRGRSSGTCVCSCAVVDFGTVRKISTAESPFFADTPWPEDSGKLPAKLKCCCYSSVSASLLVPARSVALVVGHPFPSPTHHNDVVGMGSPSPDPPRSPVLNHVFAGLWGTSPNRLVGVSVWLSISFQMTRNKKRESVSDAIRFSRKQNSVNGQTFLNPSFWPLFELKYNSTVSVSLFILQAIRNHIRQSRSVSVQSVLAGKCAQFGLVQENVDRTKKPADHTGGTQ